MKVKKTTLSALDLDINKYHMVQLCNTNLDTRPKIIQRMFSRDAATITGIIRFGRDGISKKKLRPQPRNIRTNGHTLSLHGQLMSRQTSG